jgi:Na+/melibiose symporter-like transporter
MRREPFLGRLLFADLMQGFAGGALASMLAFYALALGVGERASLIFLCFFVSGIVFVPLWIRASYRLGKARTIGLASLVSIPLVGLLALAPHGNLVAVCAAFAAFGSTMGVWIFLMRSILADLVAREEAIVGAPRAGLVFGLFVMTQKAGAGIATGVCFWILDLMGFRPGGEIAPSHAVAIVALAVGPAALGHAVMAWVTLTWRGDAPNDDGGAALRAPPASAAGAGHGGAGPGV